MGNTACNSGDSVCEERVMPQRALHADGIANGLHRSPPRTASGFGADCCSARYQNRMEQRSESSVVQRFDFDKDFFGYFLPREESNSKAVGFSYPVLFKKKWDKEPKRSPELFVALFLWKRRSFLLSISLCAKEMDERKRFPKSKPATFGSPVQLFMRFQHHTRKQ